jgi:hypothetical protein
MQQNDPSLRFLRMTASNKKVDGPQIQAIRRVNHEWNATNLFHIIQHLLHWKRSHNLCDNLPAFHLTACESLDEKILTTAVAQSINLKLWLFVAAGPAELAPCAAVFPLHGYLPAGNHLLCFSMSNFPLPVYVLLRPVISAQVFLGFPVSKS